VLIDYENVQPATLSVLAQEYFKIIVFVGANQAKVAFDIVESLQKFGDRASYVKIAGNGPNALDFHIAYYIGSLAAADPGAFFHIISKDTGFDPLIAHLKSKNIFARRSKDVADLPLLRAANSKSPTEKIAVIVDNLRPRGASRPRTVKTLSSTINSIFQKSLSETELAKILERMAELGMIRIEGTKVSYALPE
jgi:hypothetical protein